MRDNNNTCNWSTGIPWWHNSFSKYNRWEHWARRYWIWESIFRLDWKMTPKSLLQSNCSMSSTRGGSWKCWTLGCLKTICFVLSTLRMRLLRTTQCLVWLNSISILTSVCSRTNSVVSSAFWRWHYYQRQQTESLFMTIYNLGPIADPFEQYWVQYQQ